MQSIIQPQRAPTLLHADDELVIYIWNIIGFSSLGMKMRVEVFPSLLPSCCTVNLKLCYIVF